MKSLAKKLIVVSLTLATGSLLAQPAPTPVDLDATVELSVQDMAARMTEMTKQVEDDERRVLVLQLKARKDKDIIRLTCINDKLVQIKALRNIFESARTSFEADVNRPTQFEAATNARVQIQQLREAAYVCAGEIDLQSAQDSDWEAPDIPDDPADDLFPDVLEPPAYASPYN